MKLHTFIALAMITIFAYGLYTDLGDSIDRTIKIKQERQEQIDKILKEN